MQSLHGRQQCFIKVTRAGLLTPKREEIKIKVRIARTLTETLREIYSPRKSENGMREVQGNLSDSFYSLHETESLFYFDNKGNGEGEES